MSGDYHQDGIEEFTIRYRPDMDVKLRIAGKTLMITVDQDSIYHLEEIAADEDLRVEEEEDETPVDYEAMLAEAVDSEYVVWGIVGLFVVVAIYIILTMFRRKTANSTKTSTRNSMKTSLTKRIDSRHEASILVVLYPRSSLWGTGPGGRDAVCDQGDADARLSRHRGD